MLAMLRYSVLHWITQRNTLIKWTPKNPSGQHFRLKSLVSQDSFVGDFIIGDKMILLATFSDMLVIFSMR